ncbi:hypothetical protein M434DRAFT_237090 [Hypoxylon sp. CO27-5]|nr:hypothetical protein M434DRAFT_237090 [Hypoxylon sp. CO27-5]
MKIGIRDKIFQGNHLILACASRPLRILYINPAIKYSFKFHTITTTESSEFSRATYFPTKTGSIRLRLFDQLIFCFFNGQPLLRQPSLFTSGLLLFVT